MKDRTRRRRKMKMKGMTIVAFQNVHRRSMQLFSHYLVLMLYLHQERILDQKVEFHKSEWWDITIFEYNECAWAIQNWKSKKFEKPVLQGNKWQQNQIKKRDSWNTYDCLKILDSFMFVCVCVSSVCVWGCK